MERDASSLPPFVSIIIPCRNDRGFIDECLKSVIAVRYPRDRLEVLVIDGMSDDGTRELVEDLIRGYEFVKLLYNPKRITPAALNVGILHSTGDIIIRVDGHSRITRDYVFQCVEALQKFNVDNVGGNMVTLPGRSSLVSHAIALCLRHWFGVGNSFRKITQHRRQVDTVFGGCYRRETFEKIGLFNEHLPRSQDFEFNARLRRAGGRILLVPEIVSYYFACPTFRQFWCKNFEDGLWAVIPFAESDVIPVSLRHLVPLAFIIGLLGSVALSLATSKAVWLFVLVAAAYLSVSLTASVGTALSKKDERYLLLLPAVFANRHFGYGIGSLWGVCWLFRTWVRRHIRHL